MSRDVESGGENSLYPMNNPELRWSFIRKVYSITTFQLLLIVAVVSVVLFVRPVANFFNSTQGIVVYIVLIFVSLITLCVPPISYYKQYPLGYFLLLFINISSALPVGLTCVFAGGKISLEIVILITIMMFILTLYTFWAAKEGHDLSLLHPFLLGSLSILIFLSIIQIIFPMGIPLRKLLSHNFGCVVSIICCGFIVFNTNHLIKTSTSTYEQHIQAFVIMYLLVIITFFIPLLILRLRYM